jgi:hypothetical protein
MSNEINANITVNEIPIILYLLFTYVIFMCLSKNEISSLQHIFIVLVFLASIIFISNFSNLIIMYQQIIDINFLNKYLWEISLNNKNNNIEFDNDFKINKYLDFIQKHIINFILQDYNNSKLKVLVKRMKKMVNYFLIKSKNNAECKI